MLIAAVLVSNAKEINFPMLQKGFIPSISGDLRAVSNPGRILPCMAYTGTCRWIGCDFCPLCPEQGISVLTSLNLSLTGYGCTFVIVNYGLYSIQQSKIGDVCRSLKYFKILKNSVGCILSFVLKWDLKKKMFS